ncbi:carbonic anhydrase [Pseudokordiimonas caeni]|uniref:carbonic anhydrase n=1 Tax=Pseudokordiimonas caeni TaxID=2997908 RepID=UPI002811AF30|nr:carbonic anhydrase [Pseudokordiimonas caeni]
MTLDQRLIDGYRRFLETDFERDRELYHSLAEEGQTPHTLVIACSDSRVLPQHVLGAGPGDMFLVRNVAALVPPFEDDAGYHGTSAAIEFAVTSLGVKNVIVMGHAKCGGVGCVADGSVKETSFVGRWVRPLREWLHRHDDLIPKNPTARARLLERAAVHLSVENLMTFPFIAERVAARTLNVEGLILDISNGELLRVIAKPDGIFDVQSVLNEG